MKEIWQTFKEMAQCQQSNATRFREMDWPTGGAKRKMYVSCLPEPFRPSTFTNGMRKDCSQDSSPITTGHTSQVSTCLQTRLPPITNSPMTFNTFTVIDKSLPGCNKMDTDTSPELLLVESNVAGSSLKTQHWHQVPWRAQVELAAQTRVVLQVVVVSPKILKKH